MSFEKVLNGILRYMNEEIYRGMNDWQEVFARIAVSRLIGNSDSLKNSLINNGYIKTFAIMDEEGNVDVDGIARDLRDQIDRKGKLVLSLPMFGTFTFTASDVDKLHSMITEGRSENY